MDGLIHGNISGVLLYSDTKRNTSVLVLYITNDLDTPFLQKLQKIEKSSFINHVFLFFYSVLLFQMTLQLGLYRTEQITGTILW